MISNCFIYRNHATDGGGGVLVAGADEYVVELNNNTIVNNTIAHSGGTGVRINSWAGAPVIEGVNNIIYFNTANSGDTDQCSEGGGTLNLSYSSIEEKWVGDGNITDDPLFEDSAEDNYHLSSGSPCIDTGDPDSPSDPDGTRANMGAWNWE